MNTPDWHEIHAELVNTVARVAGLLREDLDTGFRSLLLHVWREGPQAGTG